MKPAVMLFISSLALATLVHAAPEPGAKSTAFDAANKLYEEGRFPEAATAYERMLEGGAASGPLYYNWGNAQFKAGRIGRAIAAYRQAESLSPRDPDVLTNLKFARNQVQGPTHRAGWAERTLGMLSLNEWSVSAAAALWIWFGILVARQLRPALRRPLRNFAWIAGVLTVLVSAGLALNLHARLFEQRAIVVAGSAAVRNGPFEESPSAFTAQDGAELVVLDRKDDWLQVSADGRRPGWIARKPVLVTPAR
jgi:tetratricopeptide (TPR) repeat protein